jgi:hypothetical protein
MITTPPDFPAAAHAVIERALADAEDAFIAASAGAGPVRSASVPGDITYLGMWDPSDRAAVLFVLEVFETMVQVSCDAARAGHWPAATLRTTTEGLLVQLTALAYSQKHSKGDGDGGRISLDDFTTIVHRELRTCPFWSGLQTTIRELSAPTAQPPAPVEADSQRSPDRQGPLAQRAAWLRCELERRAMTLTRLHKVGGPERKTATKILNAMPVSEHVVKRLAIALSVKRTDIP